jgi:hypothetical protein
VKNEWKQIGNGQIKIKLTQGKVTLADEADMAIIGAHRWCAHWNGRHWYAVTALWTRQRKTKLIGMHRLLEGAPPKTDTDHINGNTLDNRRQNLRIATRSQNSANKPKYKQGGASVYKGVTLSYQKEKPWKAQIKIDGRGISLGAFETEIEAAWAYNAAALEHWGEFAYLNEVPQ